MDKINFDLRSMAMVISAMSLSLIIVRRIPLDRLPLSPATLTGLLACCVTGTLLMYGPADPTVLFAGIMLWFLLEANDIIVKNEENRGEDSNQKSDWWKFWRGWSLYGGSRIPREEEERVDDAHVDQSKDGWHFWKKD